MEEEDEEEDEEDGENGEEENGDENNDGDVMEVSRQLEDVQRGEQEGVSNALVPRNNT